MNNRGRFRAASCFKVLLHLWAGAQRRELFFVVVDRRVDAATIFVAITARSVLCGVVMAETARSFA